jgi:hypothetical protein
MCVMNRPLCDLVLVLMNDLDLRNDCWCIVSHKATMISFVYQFYFIVSWGFLSILSHSCP